MFNDSYGFLRTSYGIPVDFDGLLGWEGVAVRMGWKRVGGGRRGEEERRGRRRRIQGRRKGSRREGGRAGGGKEKYVTSHCGPPPPPGAEGSLKVPQEGQEGPAAPHPSPHPWVLWDGGVWG